MESLDAQHTTSPPPPAPPALPAALTPGPWWVDPVSHHGWPEGQVRSLIRAGTEPHAVVIGKAYAAAAWEDRPAERLANARLMAAAPALYTALQDLVALLREAPEGVLPDRAQDDLVAAERALAGVRGPLP